MSDSRRRSFAGVIYPESMPEDWDEYLTSLHIKILLSPLHDKDLNPDHQLKKPHYHILAMFDGPQPKERWLEILHHLGSGSDHVEFVQSTPGYARYLCHLDNPEKEPYPPSEVKEYGGADYQTVIARIQDDMRQLMGMMNVVRDYNFTMFSDFADWAAQNNPEYFRLLACKFSVFMREYIKSYTYSQRTDFYF